MNKTIKDMAIEAIEEAKIMECARSEFDIEHMLFVAGKLSGIPYKWIKEVYYAAWNV